MKKCDAVRDLLSPYIEGEVSPREREKIEAHLDGCGACRDDIALLRQTVAALREMPDMPPPAAILDGIREEISPSPRKGFFRRFFGGSSWVGVPVGALAMAVLGIGAFVLQDRYFEPTEGPGMPAPREAATSTVEMKGAAKDRTAPLPAPAVTPEAVRPEDPAEESEEELRTELLVEGPATVPAPGPPPPPPEEPAAPKGPAVEGGYAPSPTFEEKKTDGSSLSFAKRENVPARGVKSDAFDDKALNMDLDMAQKTVPAPTPPMPAAAPRDIRERDFSRQEAAESTEAKEVRRLLKENEFLPSGRRDGIDTPLAVTGGALDGAADRRGGEAGMAGFDAGNDTSSFKPGKAAVEERPEAAKKQARSETARRLKQPAPAADFSKAIPPREPAGQHVPLRAEDSLQAAAGRAAEETVAGNDLTEVLTILSLRGDEAAALRRSIRESGGQLLEMKSMGALQSRQVAQPFQTKIPATQVISRGWQIRALLPAEQVTPFVTAVEKNSHLSLLSRSQVPAARRPAPGIQSIEINLVH